jgi:hypothetical protein
MALTGLALVLGLAISDGLLVHSVRKQQAALDTFAARQSLSLPKTGAVLPTLAGRSLKTGTDFSIVPVSTKRMTVLVFREACNYCEQNWKNWETLFDEPSDGMPVVFVSGDSALSDSYRQKHPMLDRHLTLIGIKPELLSSLKLDATPQTVIVVEGKVKKDWAGVLNDDDVKEVKQAVANEIAPQN